MKNTAVLIFKRWAIELCTTESTCKLHTGPGIPNAKYTMLCATHTSCVVYHEVPQPIPMIRIHVSAFILSGNIPYNNPLDGI